jgi:nucleoside-diphosphate-sugar epimerase
MNICIIGGSGFVGSRLTEILKQEHEVTILDKNPSAFYPDNTIIANICDQETLRRYLKGFDCVVHLAAEHRDDVFPVHLYYDVNVQGTRNVLDAMDANGIRNLIFTSSVAIYGLNKPCPAEGFPADPFNHYGKSKLQAEELINEWINADKQHSAVILRPTVIFGERNRGNVYNLLKQIASGRFLRVGKGNNFKSMAYVGNVVAFIQHQIKLLQPGLQVYNYIDKPDLSIKELIGIVEQSLGRKVPSIVFPHWLGMLAGYGFDILAWIIRQKLPISSVRIQKYCATTQFDASKVHTSGFKAPYLLEEGIARTIRYEFTGGRTDNITFKTE